MKMECKCEKMDIIIFNELLFQISKLMIDIWYYFSFKFIFYLYLIINYWLIVKKISF